MKNIVSSVWLFVRAKKTYILPKLINVAFIEKL